VHEERREEGELLVCVSVTGVEASKQAKQSDSECGCYRRGCSFSRIVDAMIDDEL
jgi:hypothetical protein